MTQPKKSRKLPGRPELKRSILKCHAVTNNQSGLSPQCNVYPVTDSSCENIHDKGQFGDFPRQTGQMAIGKELTAVMPTWMALLADASSKEAQRSRCSFEEDGGVCVVTAAMGMRFQDWEEETIDHKLVLTVLSMLQSAG
ncbi:hypothetical protein TcWFU_000750 [Taenia crassiceps]|uniref:Uncharacterized protein n=1 Tax=Taenia crassiceps TaxID=6207 RepID=A0ABR4QCI2_9CEST